MAKRGRPRKNPLPEEPAGDVAVMEPLATSEEVYKTPYGAGRFWIIGIKADEERKLVPFHHKAFGTLSFTYGKQRVINAEGWMALDAHRQRCYPVKLRYAEIQRALRKITNTVVRWIKRVREDDRGREIVTWAADIVNLSHRHKVFNEEKKTWIGGSLKFSLQPGDVPVASYLVLIPRAMLKEAGPSVDQFFEPDITKLPSMLDLDPSLKPSEDLRDEMWGGDDPEDEVW